MPVERRGMVGVCQRLRLEYGELFLADFLRSVSRELGVLSLKKEEDRTEAVSQLDLGNQTVDRDDVHRGPITVWTPEVYFGSISTFKVSIVLTVRILLMKLNCCPRVYPSPVGVHVDNFTTYGSWFQGSTRCCTDKSV